MPMADFQRRATRSATASGEGYGASIGTWHVESLLELGQTDEQQPRDRVREHARKLLADALRAFVDRE